MRSLWKNTILLTAFSLLMRVIGLGFQALLSRRMGAAAIGLFQLILSIYGLAVTLALSGVRFAVTRLTAEVLGRREPEALRPTLACCFGYALFFSALATALLWLGAPALALRWAGDPRAAAPLRALACELVFAALSAVTGATFTATGRVLRAALLQLFEQLLTVGASLLLLRSAVGEAEACLALAVSSAIGGGGSFVLSLPLLLWDLRRYPGTLRGAGRRLGPLLRLALPLALSSYARTGLSTLRHLLIPGGLQRSGASAEAALALYGTIHGLVFPVLVFPSALFSALAELLIPELTALQVAGNTAGLEARARSILSRCYRFSVGCAAVLFCFGRELGELLYASTEAGAYIRLLAPLVIVMYLDTVTDGMLKGLGQQLYSMGVNVADAALSLALVWWLLPLWAVKGYIFILFFSECFNFALSLRRLVELVGLRLSPASLLLPPLLAFGAANLAQLAARCLPLSPWPGAAAGVLLTVLIYGGLVFSR